jgi:hypothetical protein
LGDLNDLEEEILGKISWVEEDLATLPQKKFPEIYGKVLNYLTWNNCNMGHIGVCCPIIK